jgi:2-keto-4-pentenoate hydratase/2-oxohepta-3-ene-1,7-dioic acid hydratase in catechol pathway
MRIVRYQLGGDAPRYGWVHEDQVGEIEGDVFGNYMRREATLSVSAVRLLAPVAPSKILCVGRNYVEHAKELGNVVPKIPLIFMKPPSAVIGPGEAIIIPQQSKQVEFEGELVVVVGKRGRNITAEKAKQLILGYTVGNDVTARDLQKSDELWTRAKGFDTFCPFGPWIDTDFDVADAVISTRVNNEPRQMGSTQDMTFSVATLIAYVSSIMTLMPGDLLFTGTPSGVGALKGGDEVVVEIEGLGVLRNVVRAEEG